MIQPDYVNSRSSRNRATIKFCVELGVTPAKTNSKITAAHMNYKVSRAFIVIWHKCFQEDR